MRHLKSISTIVTLFLISYPGFLQLSSADEPAKQFPVTGIMPKQETGALQFLEQHPEYDGRGTVVAIFDTGVALNAPGLINTSDGQPKIIDVVDGTGSGDVDMSTVKKSEKNQLEGLSGRMLKIDPAWKNPTGDFRLGLKAGFDLFPATLVSRLKRERKKKWDLAHHKTESALREQILSWEKQNPQPSHDQKRFRKELDARLDALNAARKQYDDPGPMYDCVLIHDGSAWRAVIDTDEDADLTDEKLLTSYRTDREFATFGENSLMHFAVNIYNEGKCLSIVTESGDHGTHVAGIVAGYFPNQPELNGIAPGAQIVSVKIGDTRIGGMETGPGMVRGLRAVIENQCDLINMSYGEPTSRPNRGRLIRLFSEVVRKQNVIFVASAGNGGPALSTVGAPGGTTSALIGVGAYVSPEMMAAEYSLRKNLPGMPFTWSSRGPTLDGDWGINIFAPGGAIASVPNWQLSKSMQKNGTSMSSPNACGNIALLLSGLKATKTKYSPFSIRRALENTARPIDGSDVFAQGPGLLQVVPAFESLQKQTGTPGEQLEFAVDLPRRNQARGIYLREPHETKEPFETTVRVRPVFQEGATDSSTVAKTSNEKVDFEMRFILESSQSWVECGDRLLLNAHGNSFAVRVDPTDLEPGVHVAEILAYDAEHRSRGPIFRVPITVVQPIRISSLNLKKEDSPQSQFQESLEFDAGRIVRRFLEVPQSATWADIRFHLKADGPRTFVFHRLQPYSGPTVKSFEAREYLTLVPEKETSRSIPVIAGHALELCLAQYWTSLGESELSFEVTFHGINPDDEKLLLLSGRQGAEVKVSTELLNERLAPKAVLDRHINSIQPTEAKVQLLTGARDQLIDGRQQYQLLLTYQFTQEQPGTVSPRFPQIDDLLYDAEHGPHLWMLFDAGKRRIATDDIYPGSVKIGKGKFVVKLQLRHEDPEKLKQLKKMAMWLMRPLKSPVTLAIYSSRAAAVSEGAKFGTSILKVGQNQSLFVATPAANQIPSNATLGDLLEGSIHYGHSNSLAAGAGNRPGGFPVQFVISAKSTSTQKTEAKTLKTEPGQTGSEKLADAIRDAQLDQLKTIAFEKDRELFDRLAGKILEKHPNHLPVLVTRLHRLDDVKHRKERLPEVVAAAEKILKLIDTNKLAIHFGTNIDPENPTESARRKEMESLRATLIDTLYRKGRALGYMELPDVLAKHPVADPKALDQKFEANFAELKKWVDTTEQKYFLLHVRRERRKERFGNALTLLNKYIPSIEPNYWYIKKRRDCYEKLGWEHLWKQEANRLLRHFPKNYESF